jgi:hypothetical protein
MIRLHHCVRYRIAEQLGEGRKRREGAKPAHPNRERPLLDPEKAPGNSRPGNIGDLLRSNIGTGERKVASEFKIACEAACVQLLPERCILCCKAPVQPEWRGQDAPESGHFPSADVRSTERDGSGMRKYVQEFAEREHRSVVHPILQSQDHIRLRCQPPGCGSKLPASRPPRSIVQAPECHRTGGLSIYLLPTNWGLCAV